MFLVEKSERYSRNFSSDQTFEEFEFVQNINEYVSEIPTCMYLGNLTAKQYELMNV